jgi:dienelactone hydrolase
MHGDGPYAADGFLFTPAEAGSADALLLIPGAAGITPAAQDSAQALAAAGYQVVLLDPNRGGPPDPAPSEEQVWADVGAALQFLSARPGVRSGRVGVLGVAQGARVALRLAREQQVTAAVVEMPEAPASADLPSHTPLLASFVRSDKVHKSLQPAVGGAQIQFFAVAKTAAGDDANELFAPADRAQIRRQEIEFFAQKLGPR